MGQSKEGESTRAIALHEEINPATALRWLRQRDILGSPAYRNMRRRMEKPDPRSKITKKQCELLVSPARNLVRDQLYEA